MYYEKSRVLFGNDYERMIIGLGELWIFRIKSYIVREESFAVIPVH